MKKDKKKYKFKNLKYPIPESLETADLIRETNLHYPIKLNLKQSLKTFVPVIKDDRESRVLKELINEGSKRIEEDLSIERLIKHVRDSKLLLKHSTISNDITKFKIQYHKRNVINLDEIIKEDYNNEDYNNERNEN